MKLTLIIIILFLFKGCSFDNKTGIWENEDNFSKKDNIFKDFKKISVAESSFDKEISINKNFNIRLEKPVHNKSWNDINLSHNNYLLNFKYSNENRLSLKSKKLTRHKINESTLYDDENLILSDNNGSIIIFSTIENDVVLNFNFYKKKIKGIKKKLNLIIHNNIIYASDNIGYLYAFNYKENRVLWAKNFKIPFNSNLKIFKETLILSNQNNDIYFVNIKDGSLLRRMPTEQVTIKNEFVNNFSVDDERNLYFLNSYGTLYSINLESKDVNWFFNLNNSVENNPSNLFLGNQIILNQKNIITSSNSETYFFDKKGGSIIKKFNFSSNSLPIISGNYIFFITKNNYLLAVDLTNYEIIFSSKIEKQLNDYLNKKKFNIEIIDFKLINSDIIIFLKNSRILKFKSNGLIKEVRKLPSKVNTKPIIIDDKILYISNNNKLNIIN